MNEPAAPIAADARPRLEMFVKAGVERPDFFAALAEVASATGDDTGACLLYTSPSPRD